jgi:arsenite methyltransferase
MSDELAQHLQAHYGRAARRAARGDVLVVERSRPAPGGGAGSCCAPAEDTCCDATVGESAPFGSGVYGQDELADLPVQAVEGSLGCANPVALARLAEGEVVLDLGSGGGIDVLLSARRVGPTGRAYGVDMTPEMLELARANQARAGVTNAEFLEGRIEAVPLPEASVDVVVSNCVINLSADKRAALAEAHRVLRPGGRLAVADVVADSAMDDAQRADMDAWASCIAGAITRTEYRGLLADAGFVGIEIDDSHAVGDGLWSVFVRARKP